MWLFSFANAEHLSLTSGASPLGGRLTVLHGNRFRTLHFLLDSTFHTICFHAAPPYNYEKYSTLLRKLKACVCARQVLQNRFLTGYRGKRLIAWVPGFKPPSGLADILQSIHHGTYLAGQKHE